MLKLSLAPVPAGDIRFPGLPEWMGRLLAARGVSTAEEARRFLAPDESQLLPPEALPGAVEAVRVLRDARDKGERAVVFGDYDVDGVCAAAILSGALRGFGLSCDVYLPDRHAEGYGLNLKAVAKLAAEYRLLVTVDCGISCVEEVLLAREMGMRVIVTDHHHPGDKLPDAQAVVSPLLCDYPFPYLCGAGVAYKLALLLLGPEAKRHLDLAALATVADMVPLTGENRVLVALGLPCLLHTERVGLRRLMALAGIRDTLTSEQTGFQIAPRLNACGRMETAQIALELITTRDETRAAECAARADALNARRREEEARVILAAEEQLRAMNLMENHAIVIRGENWNSGVVGLAAGRIAEKYAYPTVVLAARDGVCVGSARSAGQVDLYEALRACEDLFLRFGGHKQAAGLTMEEKHLDDFRRRFSEAVDRQLGGVPPVPEMRLDGEMTLADVTVENIALLARMEPFGVGNPAPRFLCREAVSLSLRPVGTEGRHLKCTFMQDGTIRDGIFFGGGDFARAGGGAYEVAMTPTLNTFRGNVSPEIRVEALRLLPESLRRDEAREAEAWLMDRRDAENTPLTDDARLDEMMAGRQGTLLLCRCLPTALDMLARYPEAEFSIGEARDARAYHTVLLYGGAETVTAPYRRVVFCDGDVGFLREGAECFRRPVTDAFLALARGVFMGRDALRGCYVRLRDGGARSLSEFAEAGGLSAGQAVFALSVLGELRLIEWTLSPFGTALLPLVKAGPEESALYRYVRDMAEGDEHGILGL